LIAMEKLKNQKEKRTQVIKRPDLCTADELKKFHGLVLRGGQVTSERLPELIRRAKLLGFHYVGPRLAAVAGLKTPRESYKNRVFREAGVEHLSNQSHTELGWAVTRKEFQGSGIATSLIQKLLNQMKDEKIFATTASDNFPMRRLLTRFGFRQVGHAYGDPMLESSSKLLWFLEND